MPLRYNSWLHNVFRHFNSRHSIIFKLYLLKIHIFLITSSLAHLFHRNNLGISDSGGAWAVGLSIDLLLEGFVSLGDPRIRVIADSVHNLWFFIHSYRVTAIILSNEIPVVGVFLAVERVCVVFIWIFIWNEPFVLLGGIQGVDEASFWHVLRMLI